jgi:Ca-activated chloride channel homolog
MAQLMRCPFCGLLQDEPAGVKSCTRCGGALEYEQKPDPGLQKSYLQVQMELDQVAAPAGRNVERYLLLTIRAPKQVPPEEAAPAGKKRSPLTFTAVLDNSGSMQGIKINQAKDAVRQAIRILHAEDVFSLVTFANEVACPFEPAKVSDKTAADVENSLKKINASGQTALCGGLELGLEKAGKNKQDTTLVLLLSDGQANQGETDLEKIGQRALKAREQGMVVSTLGVGMDYNEALMSEIATQGGGRFYHVQYASMMPAFVAGELGEAANLAARNVTLTLSIPAGATLIPLSAAYTVQQGDGQALVSIGDIPCDTELEVPLRLALLAQKADIKLSLEGTLKFTSPVNHEIMTAVNRVTIRFMNQDAFQLREGVVQPVAEKVFVQMKANSVLDLSRTRAHRPADSEKKAESILASLHSYADLLGEERAEEEIREMDTHIHQVAASPQYAKMSHDAAFRTSHSRKDFDKQ